MKLGDVLVGDAVELGDGKARLELPVEHRDRRRNDARIGEE